MAENSTTNQALSPEEEAKLRKIASRRTSFKIHLAIFLLANTFLWVVWYFLFQGKDDKTFFTAILFLLIVWLLAIILHYMIVYKWTGNYKEKEFSALKQNLQKQIQEVENLKAELSSKKPQNEEITEEIKNDNSKTTE